MRSIRVCLLAGLCCAGFAAAAAREPAFDFSGTAMAACDVNDGPASQLVLEPAQASAGRLYVLVHDATPPALHGVYALSDAGYASASASLRRCEGAGEARCERATEGTLAIDAVSAGAVHGRLRFRIGGGAWRQGSFRALIAKPPRPLLCG